MLNAGVLTFQEYAVREPLPLATLHESLLDFLRHIVLTKEGEMTSLSVPNHKEAAIRNFAKFDTRRKFDDRRICECRLETIIFTRND